MSNHQSNFDTIFGWRWRKDITAGTYIDLDFTGWAGRRFLIATKQGLYCITVWSGSVSGTTFVAGNDVNFEYPGGFVVRIHNTLGGTNYVSIH